MNIQIYVLTLFWAFTCGFLLGLSFPRRRKPATSTNSKFESKIFDDHSIINEEYRNFLNYDGSKQ